MKRAVTFTICAGTSACPNHCKICVSEMTGKQDFDTTKVDWKVFEHATNIAINYKAENVLITGKGEPLLFPDQITRYLDVLNAYHQRFTRFELQTSGDGLESCHLTKWKALGLDVIAISAYYFSNKYNNEVFCNPNVRVSLEDKIKIVKDAGLKVRLSFVIMKNYIESPFHITNCLDFARDNGVFQTTFRELGKPERPRNTERANDIASFVNKHLLSPEQSREIKYYFDRNGHACDTLPFGGTIYEINGQNACLTTCLNQSKDNDELRNLIFFPPGMLSTSWEYPVGSAIL
jgi:molybdenum cofactor biosynthesis enzyme MoaA